MRILFIGDVVGRPGRRALRRLLPEIQDTHSPELTVVNAENAAGGFGVTASVLDELLGNPQIDVLTSGNHIWDKPEALQLIDREPRLLRPHNYPEGLRPRYRSLYRPCYRVPRIMSCFTTLRCKVLD